MRLNLLLIVFCMVLGIWGDYPPGTEPTRKVNHSKLLT
tara:strand:+ start:232 stop:345 length:114 start_codon:yes stop_codon:yes gene_type:complete